ncbi:hypothetical protein SELMODRAFT_71861, partial [Selaginella moellendorffii]
ANLVTVFASCGELGEARKLFDKLVNPDVVVWSNLVAAYARSGDGKVALEAFQLMALDGKLPDEIAFVVILSACSHAGLFDEARYYFTTITSDYSMKPVVEHYHCIVDLLGRLGRLDDASTVAQEMPFESNSISWTTLLSASNVQSNYSHAAEAAENAVDCDQLNSAAYILLSNL